MSQRLRSVVVRVSIEYAWLSEKYEALHRADGMLICGPAPKMLLRREMNELWSPALASYSGNLIRYFRTLLKL